LHRTTWTKRAHRRKSLVRNDIRCRRATGTRRRIGGRERSELMSTLLLEPRDAGTVEIEDISVDFEIDMKEVLHGPQACVNTCKRTVCSSFPCCPSII
jgi:hypothetical protein